MKEKENEKLNLSLRIVSQQYFPCSSGDFSLQPVHQRCDQSLLGVVGGEDQQHGVPGQTLKTGDTAGLSGEERVTEDHSLLDTPEAPQQVQVLWDVRLPGNKKYSLNLITLILIVSKASRIYLLLGTYYLPGNIL